MGRVFGVAVLCVGMLASAAAHASPSSDGFWISLGAQYRSGPWQREWGGFLAVNVPFGRFAAPRRVPDAPSLTEEPPKKENAPAPTPAAAPTASDLPAALLSPRLARGTVRHALATAGYFEMRSRLASLAARSRSSAALPELALRTQHTNGQTLRLTPTNDDPYRYVQAGTSELALEARLTWHLDRLVFADDEVRIEHLQHERDAAERRLIDFVLQRLVTWQRGRVRAADLNLDPEQRQTAELEAIGAAVELDVLTGGWFSWAIAETDPRGAADAGESAKVEVETPGHAR